MEIGAETCVMETKKITTSTNLDKINARTNIAHLPIHPFAASHDEPENANGASTTATSSRALRISSDSHTIAAEPIANPARKIIRIAPTPGAAIVSPVSPSTRAATLAPIVSVVSPAA